MFAHPPRMVQQRPVAPHAYERTPSYVPPLVPRSRAPSLQQSPTVSLPFPTRQHQPTLQSVPVPRPIPEPWVDALKDDVEAEFNLNLVDDVKAEKDIAIAAATTAAERAAILRVYDESMADIRAQARAEFQRRVEAERERRLLSNYDGKDALIAEQHSIMESIVKENVRREASPSSTAVAPPQQAATQEQSSSRPNIARSSQPIPIPMQRKHSRNGGLSGSVAAHSAQLATTSSASSSRPFPTARRDSTSTRPPPPPPASTSSSVSSVSSVFEPSSSSSSYTTDSDRRYDEHWAAVQRREEQVKRKEAAARRSAEEARRREEAAARREEDARRKDVEATRRMRIAEQREQQVLALEARTRKEMELSQKEAGPTRVRTQSQHPQSAAVPLISKVLSKVEVWQPKPRSAVAATMVPRGEAKVRA
ncbi:hypothetical protein F5148DRAFT_1201622 [Russula earlei]|uniref:Uncharacterized protein n=1 Tax=Russula earlei TaxID=71964 RepID=A0ACC0U929_9AGAM|nr:hypothetical protein F5148DRAFT_1201622 [Russula earlei]